MQHMFYLYIYNSCQWELHICIETRPLKTTNQQVFLQLKLTQNGNWEMHQSSPLTRNTLNYISLFLLKSELNVEKLNYTNIEKLKIP